MKSKLVLCFPLLAVSTALVAEERPNIIFILADDLGYGDLSSLNPNSKIKTPCLDRMVSEGVYFTDAHSSSSVSTPTRYGILTGRYNWRSRLKSGVLSGYCKALIPQDRKTMGTMLQRGSYHTGCVGKWHLGWDWVKDAKNCSQLCKQKVDYTHPIHNGPASLGFDYFYGFSGSLDMPPYVYVENENCTTTPDRITVNKGKGFWRQGPTGEDFIHENTLSHLTDKALAYIEERSTSSEPFFLYFALPAPHTPILPTSKWKGKSNLNEYGDFVMHMDDEVGRIFDKLKKLEIDDNTIVVFTSDNGCSPQAGFDELKSKGHDPNFGLRGHKADLFEGGHRVPCIVRWPRMIDGGVSNHTICLTDFYHTFASLSDVDLTEEEGEDSFCLYEVLKNPKSGKLKREATIHHSIAGQFAIRVGDWKLLVSPSSGGWSAPHPSNKKLLSTLPSMQLYNLKEDIQETNNLVDEYPRRVKKMLALLNDQIKSGRATKGVQQKNDGAMPWKQIESFYVK